jgi:hypothetical protein
VLAQEAEEAPPPAESTDAEPADGADTGDAPPPVATEVPSDGREVYTPADFTRFAPKNVLDMIRQIPGFTIVSNEAVSTRPCLTAPGERSVFIGLARSRSSASSAGWPSFA